MYRSGIIGYGAGPRRGYLGAGIGYPYGVLAMPYYGGYGYGYPGYGYGLGYGGYGWGGYGGYYGSGGLL
jgi:hypothetical protein